MSKFIRHLPCPKCRSKDNLGEYDDHFYCFGCQYHKLKNDLNTLRKRYERSSMSNNIVNASIQTTPDLPRNAMKWLLSYGISLEEIAQHKLEWCEQNGTLVLLNTGTYWQGRSFKQYGPKYMSHGYKPLTIYGEGDTIILVEDILSAIKVSRVAGYCSAPLLGSSLSTDFEDKITKQFKSVYVWLDRDKAKNAIRIKNKLKGLGITSRVVITPSDPKEYTTKEIEQWLKNR